MHWNSLRRFALTFLAVFLMASPAEANVMIPLIGFTWIGMVLALVPVIVVETLILWARVGLTFWHSTGVVTAASLASTLVGIPIACLLLLLPRPDKHVDYRKKIQWWKFRAVMRDWLDDDVSAALTRATRPTASTPLLPSADASKIGPASAPRLSRTAWQSPWRRTPENRP